MTSTGRKLGGIVAGLLLLLMLGLIQRQYGMWSLTQDGYYLTSTGLYLVVAVVFYAGVSWGFFSGENAEKVFLGGAVLVLVIAGLAASYGWFTGMVLDGTATDVFAALVWTATAIALAVVTAVVGGLAKNRREAGS